MNDKVTHTTDTLPEGCKEAINEILEFHANAFPLNEEVIIAYGYWFGQISRINEVCQAKNSKRVQERLQMLLPDLLVMANRYTIALEKIKTYYTNTPFYDPTIDIIIKRTIAITEGYQSHAAKIISGEEPCDSLMHMIKTTPMLDKLFGPYTSLINLGGAPSKLHTFRARLCSIALAYRQHHPKSSEGEIARHIIKVLEEKFESDQLDKHDLKALNTLKNLDYEGQAKYIRILLPKCE